MNIPVTLKPIPDELLESNIVLQQELANYSFPRKETTWEEVCDVIFKFVERQNYLEENHPLKPINPRRPYWGELIFKNINITTRVDIKTYHVNNPKHDRGAKYKIPFSLRFDRCTFNEGAQFVKIDFSGGISLEGCHFEGGFDVMECTLGYSSSLMRNTYGEKASVYFEDNEIHGSFSGSEFKSSASFNQNTFFDDDFSHIKFLQEVGFTRCTFKEVPDFSDSSFHEHTRFYNCDFARDNSKEVFAQVSANRFRILKNKMIEAKEDREAILFHSLELSMRHRQLSYKRDFLEKTISLFYGSINDYGWNLALPIKIIVTLLAFYTFVLFVTNGVTSIKPDNLMGWRGDLYNANYMVQCLYFSLKTVFPPLYLFGDTSTVIAANILQQISSVFISIYASLVWTMFIFSIRRRYKLF